MKKSIENAYTDYYSSRSAFKHVYPVEFVVRTFLGTYPNLAMDRSRYLDGRVLDLGYGDGRNFPLLRNLGLKVHGVEISDSIQDLALAKFDTLGIPVELRVGRNDSIPFEDGYFNYVLACHSLYYVASACDSFDKTLSEVARVLSSGGVLVASLPKPSTYVLAGARKIPGGYMEIINDPLGLRNGTIFRVFEDKEEIVSCFSKYFENFSLGACDDEYFGIQQNVWIVVCTKKNE